MRKSTVYVLAILICLSVVVIGMTTAIWINNNSQDKSNTINAACMDVSIVSENDVIQLASQYPILNADGMLLTPYKFSVKNNCDRDVDYRLSLEMLGSESNSISQDNIRLIFDNQSSKLLSSYGYIEPTIKDAYDARDLKFATISANTTEEHTLRIWIDENATREQAGKSFVGKVTLVFGQSIVRGPQ